MKTMQSNNCILKENSSVKKFHLESLDRLVLPTHTENLYRVILKVAVEIPREEAFDPWFKWVANL